MNTRYSDMAYRMHIYLFGVSWCKRILVPHNKARVHFQAIPYTFYTGTPQFLAVFRLPLASPEVHGNLKRKADVRQISCRAPFRTTTCGSHALMVCLHLSTWNKLRHGLVDQDFIPQKCLCFSACLVSLCKYLYPIRRSHVLYFMSQ